MSMEQKFLFVSLLGFRMNELGRKLFQILRNFLKKRLN